MVYRCYIKRLLDIFIASCSLILLCPAFLLLFILIKKDDGGPVLFTQKRMGRYKIPFYIYKFRSMKINAPPNCPTEKLEHPEQWITDIGKWMRRTSVDELPQIINVLKGEMSIIGPRPVVLTEEKLIAYREYLGVHELRPGITGWAQINGRDEVSTKEKAMLDKEYVIHLSFLFDIKIFILTIQSVIFARGFHEGIRQKENRD